MASEAAWTFVNLLKRDALDADPDEPEAGQKEIFASWSLFILLMLLIAALFTSYMLQTRKIEAVHETVVSIFAGMVVGLILRLTAAHSVLGAVSFDYQFFFNLLLPPIILASGYELHQGNFFHNLGSILTFAFAGTFISALVLGLILFLWAWIPLEGLNLTFVEAMSVGATLSATDPVTVLAIFNTYKVDPKLYTVIFGESILNDAIAIVLFETAQKYKQSTAGKTLNLLTIFESIGLFLGVFFGSLVIGIVVGIATSLLLKFTLVRRYSKIESCLVILIAYATYFLSNAIHMSGIVSLLFCGICLKHYAYHNMSRRTQLTTKFIFQVMAQLSENFIFIYLGLSLFTETDLEYKPLFILVTVVGICAARWMAVFPLSKVINSVLRYRAKRSGKEAEEMPYAHQAMLFWAGLRGAVGVALAQGLTGPNSSFLRATVLVVVVLTVIIFGGTTARMLEILGIRTGVVEEIDSDDEFDIEVVTGGGGSKIYSRKSGSGFGHTPRPAGNGVALGSVNHDDKRIDRGVTYSSGSLNGNTPPLRPDSMVRRNSNRANSSRNGRSGDGADQGLLSPESSIGDDDADLDLPPSVTRSPRRAPSPRSRQELSTPQPPGGAEASRSGPSNGGSSNLSTTGTLRQLISDAVTEDAATLFKQIDEGFIKPHLLLDPGRSNGRGSDAV